MSLDIRNSFQVTASPEEGEERRRARVTRERDLVAQARAELEAGLGIADEHLEAWLDRLERNPDAELPSATPVRTP